MKKTIGLLFFGIFLTGCYANSLTMVGPATGVASGKLSETVTSTTVRHIVKKQTGKTPLGHAIAYAEEKNPKKKKETCISSFEITRSEFCTIAKKQIKLKSTAMVKKTTNFVKEFPKNKIKEISKIEKIAKKSIIYNRR